MAKKRHTRTQIMSAIRFFEQTGNATETAKKYNISRPTLYKWKEKYKQEYKERKTDIEDHALTVEAKKLILKEGTADLTEKTIDLYKQLLHYFLNPEDTTVSENIKNLKNSDKIFFIDKLLPYVLEKKGTLPPPDPKGPQTNNQYNFFMNLIQKIQDGNNKDEIQRNIETVTVSHNS